MSVASKIIIEGSEEKKKIELMKGEIASENGLLELLCKIFDGLSETEAVEIKVYRKFILVGKRLKGHGSEYYHKFINYGLANGNRTTTLAFAIRTIDGGSLQSYCYDAMNGDVQALRKTTQHLVRAYNAKIKRLKEKGKDPKEIEYFEGERDKVMKRLEKGDEEFLELTEPILIEIPKDPEMFYDEETVTISGDDGIDVD